MAQADTDTTTRTLTKPKARRVHTLRAAQRRRIENAIEQMINALDALDAPAEDLEDDHEDGGQVDDDPIDGDFDDEPSLGSFDRMANQEKSWRVSFTTWSNGDELDEADREGDEADQENQIDDGPIDTDERESDECAH